MAEPPKKIPTPGQAPKPAPRFSNQKSQGQFAMEELKKTALSRGIPVETLIAQMVEQYLKEDKAE